MGPDGALLPPRRGGRDRLPRSAHDVGYLHNPEATDRGVRARLVPLRRRRLLRRRRRALVHRPLQGRDQDRRRERRVDRGGEGDLRRRSGGRRGRGGRAAARALERGDHRVRRAQARRDDRPRRADRRAASDRLDGYKVPKAVIVVDELPRTSTGKIQKNVRDAPSTRNTTRRADRVPVLTSHVDPNGETYRANRAAQLALLERARRAARAGRRRRRRALPGPAPRPGPAAGPRARSSCSLDRDSPVPRAVAAGRVGHRVHRRRQHRHRHRRGVRRRVRDHRARPDRARRRDEPVHAAEDPARAGDRPGQPAAGDQPRRVGRRRPADAGRPVRPRRADLPRPHRAVGAGDPDHRARVRQLDRRRRVRARHVRLRGAGRRAGQGVPRRPAAGEDGDRRGIRRRGARRRRDALPGLRASPTTSPSTSSTCIRIGREIVARLNWRKLGPAAAAPSADPRYDPDELLGIVSADLQGAVRPPRGARPRRRRLRASTSTSRSTAPSLVTGWASIHGYPVGVLANHRGVLFSEEAKKATEFILLANQTDTPLVFLQNTTGYMVGKRLRAGRHHQGRRQDDQRGHQLARSRTSR